jgi:hypothetical protein
MKNQERYPFSNMVAAAVVAAIMFTGAALAAAQVDSAIRVDTSHGHI